MTWSGLSQSLGLWGDALLLPGVSLDWSRWLLWKYLLGSLVAAHLLGVASIAGRISFGPWTPVIRWAGSTTFTLYLLHFPLINVLNAVLPLPDTGGARVLTLAACALPSLFALAWIFERQRGMWRCWLDKGWARAFVT